MADGTIKYGVEVDSSGAVKGLKDLEQQAQRSANNTSTAFEKVDKVVSGILAAEGALAGLILKSGLDFNAEVEGYQTSFEVMTGSAEEAFDIVDRLKSQAASTPFDLTQLAKTTQLMMNYGIEGDKAIDMMGRLGDVAQGDAAKLDSISLAYSQMSSLGKVQLMDIKQMINGGFNPLQEIAERTGESMSSLYDRISNGTLSVNEINESIIRATSVGGKYFQSMDKQSQTLKGRWNTLKDTVSEATGKMTAGISSTLAQDVLPKAIEAVEWLGNNFETLIPIIASVTAGLVAFKLAANMDTIIASVKELVTIIATVGTSLAGMIGILAALAALIVYLGVEANKPSEAFNIWSQEIENVNSKTQTLKQNMEGFPDLMSSLGNNIETTASQAETYISRLEELEGKGELTAEEQEEWNKTLEALCGIMPEVTGLIDEETGKIEGGTSALRDYVAAWRDKQYAQATEEIVAEAIKNEMEAIQNLASATSNYQSLLAEQNANYEQEAVLLDAANQAMGTQYDSLTAAADALQAYADATSDPDLTKLANQMLDLNTKIEEHDTLLGEAEKSYKSASTEREKAGQILKAYSDAEAAALSGTKTYAEAYTGAMEQVANITNDTVGEMQDATGEYTDLTAQWKLAADRNIDQGLISALQSAGFGSQQQLAWILTQSDAQLQQWNEVFRKDSKEAVSQISKAFAASDAPKQSSTLARTVEGNFNPNLYSAGANAAEGAASGMEAKRSLLRNKAASLASSIRNAFNVRLDIKSPSRVMAESGEYIVEGVEVGIQQRMGALRAMAVKAADTVSTAFKPSVDMSGINDLGEFQAVQQTEMISQMAAQVNSAPILVQLDVDGQQFAQATALPMSYALETLRVAEVRG